MALSEIEQFPALCEVIFGKDPTSFQAKNMGIYSGVPLMFQEQLDLYRELREDNQNPDSDQVVYATVLEQTGGPVEVFKAAYPNIFKRNLILIHSS